MASDGPRIPPASGGRTIPPNPFGRRRALDGGGLVSLRLDTQGKTYGYALLRMGVDVPDDLAVERLV